MIVCCFPWWNLGGLKFKRVLFISGVLASSLPWRAGKCPESDRRAGPWMPKVGRLKDTAEKLFRSLIFWCWSTFSFVTVASLECDELPKIVWPESTFLFETIVKTDDEMGSFAGKLGRHFSVTFSGLFKYAEKLFEPWATFSFADFGMTKVFDEKFRLLLSSESSHLKNLQPSWPGSPLLRLAEQAKKLRPWFGPCFDTIKRLLRRPHEQIGGVLRILNFLL